ncbi:MAG: ROK family protein [Ruminiclostridium sp.]
MPKRLIGIDIGGTKCAVITGSINNYTPQLENRLSFLTSACKGPYEVLNRCAEMIVTLTGENRKDYIGIGISCGGPLDSKKGIILSPPNLIGWDHIEVVRYFQERFKLPTYLQNDANACTIAEWKFGAGKGCRNMAFLTFGTGLGAGLILNNHLYRGSSDMAGEVGHVRLSRFGPTGYGKIGSFEGFCSGGGIVQLALQKMQEQLQQGINHPLLVADPGVTAKAVFEMAHSGDALCLEVCDIVGKYLGYGLSILIDILNPERIVIGSIYTRNEDILLPIAQKIVEKECLPSSLHSCNICKSMLGEQIGDIAALTIALGMDTEGDPYNENINC